MPSRTPTQERYWLSLKLSKIQGSLLQKFHCVIPAGAYGCQLKSQFKDTSQIPRKTLKLNRVDGSRNPGF